MECAFTYPVRAGFGTDVVDGDDLVVMFHRRFKHRYVWTRCGMSCYSVTHHNTMASLYMNCTSQV